MLSRRHFIGALSGSLALGSLNKIEAFKESTQDKKRLAIITTEWRYPSHAWHMGERFLTGYPIEGHWHHPQLDVVSAYVDQIPDNDLSHDRSQQFGFPLYESIDAALRCGGDRLAVDAVLVIGEHGNYAKNELGQTLYPRYEFFEQVVDVFKADGHSVPVFNDKHLSWNWEWAKKMVDTAAAMDFPLMAGSSLPMTWRMPSIDMPQGAQVEELMCVAMGGIDSYDFHALEVIQCMAERRQGGETGVASVAALRGDSVWRALELGIWGHGDREQGGWLSELFHACLCRSQTLTQAENNSHRYPTPQQIRQWVKDPVAYRIEYADGTKATMLLLSGLVGDFTFAAKLKGQVQPLSTLFYLPPVPNVVYSAALMSKVEQMFMTGRAAYPVERTLLTSGILASALQSLADGEQKIDTPHLAVTYQGPQKSQFWQR
ncbi:MAG: hypothetical protein ABGX16_09450 [Pirellulales bacterium]